MSVDTSSECVYIKQEIEQNIDDHELNNTDIKIEIDAEEHKMFKTEPTAFENRVCLIMSEEEQDSDIDIPAEVDPLAVGLREDTRSCMQIKEKEGKNTSKSKKRKISKAGNRPSEGIVSQTEHTKNRRNSKAANKPMEEIVSKENNLEASSDSEEEYHQNYDCLTMNRKHKKVQAEGRNIICNVIKFFDEQKRAGQWLFPLSRATELAAAATGKSTSLIKKIRKESEIAEKSLGKN